MPSGKAPSITEASVRAALAMLTYTTADKTADVQPLYALALVEEFLNQPQLPRMGSARAFAVNHILTSLIGAEFAARRQSHNLPPPNPKVTLADLPAVLALDAQGQAPELIGWSVLFHEHVCSGLNVLRQQYALWYATDERQLRRYYQHAVTQLTQRLIEAEWHTRRQQRQRRLLAQLPAPSRLIGRAAELQRLEVILQRETAPCLWISGSAGIGKSVLVNALIRRQLSIDTTDIDDCIWLENPLSVGAVYDQLRQELVASRSQSNLEQILLMRRVWLVLDSVDGLGWTSADWQELGKLVGQVTLFVTSQHLPPAALSVISVPLAELAQPAVMELVATIAQAHHWTTDNLADYTAAIWATVGGNPLGVRQALFYLEHYGADIFQQHTLEELYARAFGQFSPQEQRLLIWCACYEGGIVPEWFTELGGEVLATVAQLIQRGWLKYQVGVNPFYVLATSALCFIRGRYQADPALQADFQEFLQTVVAYRGDAYPLWLEKLLAQMWLKFPSDWLALQVQRWAMLGIQHGQAATWLQIIVGHQLYSTDSGRLAYATALRRLGRRKEAQMQLDLLLQRGQQGEFITQGYAMLGYAGYLRETGHYAKALQFVHQAATIAQHYAQGALQEQVIVQQIQIALDQQNMKHLTTLLDQLPLTATYGVLRLEIYWLLQQTTLCYSLGQQLLASRPGELEQAYIYTILGRCYEREERWLDSLVCFENALYLLERSGDILASARTQSNVAALLLRQTDIQEHLDRAENLLQAAQTSQRQIQDRVGLLTTQRNLHYLLQQRTLISTS
jgi:tetratricopeptide (TPR) repeat protein